MSSEICFDNLFSNSASAMKKSVIRELLKLTTKPEIISFAGGLPAPETFPVSDLDGIISDLLKERGTQILQYGPTEGDSDLKDILVERYNKNFGSNVNLTKDNCLIVSASQQSLDALGKIFLNPGDKILVESPTYVGGLGAFKSYEPEIIGVTLQNDGIDIKELEEKLDRIYNKENSSIKFLYTIPDFQNPAGVTMSLEKRKKVLELSEKYNFLILEDSPYRELRYTGNHVKSLYELNKGERVISLYTFSKIFCPGFRLGWIFAPEKIINKLIIAKQSMDLATSPFNQAITYEFIKKGLLDSRINKNIEIYSEKCSFMLECIEKYFPKADDLNWTTPEGGLFLWVNLPEYINTDKMFEEAINNNVAYVIGSAFYGDNPKHHSMRLNFSYPSKEEIEEGVKRLADVINKNLK